MNKSKKYTNYLLIGVGVLILLLSYLFVFQPYSDKANTLETDIATLTSRHNQLKTESDSQKKYTDGIAQAKATVADTMKVFPNAVRPEDFIMFAKSLETQFGFKVNNVKFGDLVNLSTVTAVHNQDNYKVPFTTLPLTLHKTSATIEGAVSYTSLKNAISFIYSQNTLTTLESLTISYDSASGALTSSMILNKYYITGGDDEYYPTNVPDISVGNTSPFGIK